jgi:heptosyltransferase II
MINSSQQSIYKILIIAPSWVGDMVMASTLLQQLRLRHGVSTQIDVLAPRYLETLLTRMPNITNIWSTSLNHGRLDLAERWHLACKMQQQNYDQAIILPNSLKSALIPFLAKIPKRTGWRGEMRYLLLNDLRILNKKELPLMVQRFAALAFDHVPKSAPPTLASLPLPKLSTTNELIIATLHNMNLKMPTKPVLALCPGAEYGEAKRWPAEHFAAIAQNKIQAGWEVWLLGGNNDRTITAAIKKTCNAIGGDNSCLDFADKTTLAEAVDLLSLATAVITNDSGLMHMAAALNRPLIALYGASSPQFTPPLTQQENRCEILSLNLPCSPCFKRQCPLKHFRCMQELAPSIVLAALERLVKTVGNNRNREERKEHE